MIETSFLSGSENLYKYLVTMGILLVFLTVYYPLKEKQLLELKTNELEIEVKKLNLSIQFNKISVLKIRQVRNKNHKPNETLMN
jgi:hypothetical protein